MSKSGFTPGDWRAHRLPKAIGLAEWEICWSDDGECVAEVVHEEADAYLMAASKDMYKALSRIIDELPHSREWLDPVLERMAKDALLKAKGGTPNDR